MADDMIKRIPVVSGTTPATVTPPTAAASNQPIPGTDVSADTDEEDPLADAKDEMRARFMLLPEDLKQTIMGDSYQLGLFQIAKDLKLTYEELGMMQLDTTMVLLGMIRPEDYRDQLQFELKKNDPEMNAIVTAVNEKIFAPIRVSLEKLYSAKKEASDYIPESIVTGIVPKTAPVVVAPPAPAAVPATPPAQTAASVLSSSEKSVLEKTGVVISETPTPAPQPMQSARMPERNDLLKSIENPPKASSGIIADKLASMSPVVAPAKTTDYSVPKMSSAQATAPAASPIIKTDPYREPIE